MIATLAIPTSIVPTFLFMYAMGFSLNNITMLGLILAIGIVIDDAVVVHENIFRHMEEGGLDAMSAARKGTQEIVLAVLATSLSLVVIFVPVAFMGGHRRPFLPQLRPDGRLRRTDEPVRVVHADADALRPLPQDRSGGGRQGQLEVGVDLSRDRRDLRPHARLVAAASLVLVLVCLLVVASTVPLAMSLGANLVPRDDQSEFQISIRTPEGYTLERTDGVVAKSSSGWPSCPGVVQRFTTIGQKTGRGQGDVTRAFDLSADEGA